MNGIILVDKPIGMTSREVVNKVSKILKTKQIGHTGTLDPMASGVLVLCVGKATKLVELLTAEKKEYIAEMLFGIETDTLDTTGSIIKEEKKQITKEQVIKTLNSMTITYQQEVPKYSAIHVNGKKLYEYARNNEQVELPSKQVTIYEINFEKEVEFNRYQFKVKVSKGTYIRSFIRDIAYKLDTVASMSMLRRTKQGKYDICDCDTLEQIEKGHYHIIPIEEVLKDYFTIIADSTLEKKVRNGQLLENKYEKTTVLFLNQEKKVLALYQLYEKDKNYIKPWKMFW